MVTVVGNSVTAVGRAAEAMAVMVAAHTGEGWSAAKATTVESWSSTEAAAAAKMHAASTVPTSAKVHAATVTTAATMTSTAMSTTATHLDGQALRGWLGRIRGAGIDQ